MIDNDTKFKQEIERFDDDVNVHDLPNIFHYWSNKYLKPMLEIYDIKHPDDLFVNNILEAVEECGVENPSFISIGAGNCDTEIRIAKRLMNKGLIQFNIECLDLNQNMLDRGYKLAIDEGVIGHMSFQALDINSWSSKKEYVCVIANQSLHHIVNLENLFEQITSSLHENGRFVTSDMIGRNGHQRWPEALIVVHRFWQELPESHKYNHQLKRTELMYENWDCSSEGFEGIRAQDILPLLIDRFNFQLFIGFSNVVDIFVDRGFGHNFNVDNKWDTDFIDRVHEIDERSIFKGSIKPTHMMAVMKKSNVEKPQYSRGLSPEHCVRKTQF